MTISTKNVGRPCATVISNDFIDNYMTGANGEYVKVYLYLLRHTGEDVTDKMIAEALELTEGDVVRAISYWNRKGVLDTENHTAPDIEKLSNDTEYREMLYVLQKYLAIEFGQKEFETISYMYDVMKMPRELIEYLVEICVQKGKTSVKYIESVAMDWKNRGIDSVERAKEENAMYVSETYGVMKAFGINDRQPAAAEKRYIDKWFRTQGFTPEVVLEACGRTIKATAKPSFRYADSILTKWKEAGVKNISDIQKLDKRHEEQSARAKQTQYTPSGQSSNRFNNFDQRKDDLDSRMIDRLERKIKG